MTDQRHPRFGARAELVGQRLPGGETALLSLQLGGAVGNDPRPYCEILADVTRERVGDLGPQESIGGGDRGGNQSECNEEKSASDPDRQDSASSGEPTKRYPTPRTVST